MTAYQSAVDWSDASAEDQLEDLTAKAGRLLDLSGIPPARRDDVLRVSVVQLQEVLDRVDLPAYADIPDAGQAAEAGLTRWTIPNTEITIARVEEGDREGQWLFNPATVARLSEFYDRVADLPFKQDAILARLGDDVPFYEYLLYSPGSLMPVEWILEMPAWANEPYGHVLAWQWLGIALVLVLTLALIVAIFRVVRRVRSRHEDSPVVQAWLRVVPPVLGAVVFSSAEYLIDEQLSVCCETQAVLETGLLTLTLLFVAWTIIALGGVVAELILRSPRIRSESVDASLVRIVTRVTSLLIAVWVLIDGVESFGISFIPLVAGLGIGGLAIALAVRPHAREHHRRVHIVRGQACQSGRLLPVRGADGHGRGDRHPLHAASYPDRHRGDGPERGVLPAPTGELREKKPDPLPARQSACATRPRPISSAMCWPSYAGPYLGHPRVASDGLRIRFRHFRSSSLEIEIFAYIRTNIWLDYLAICEDLNLRTMEVVRESGTDFALPSQTAYLARDSSLNDERRRAAEDEVAGWRERGQLPFPNFDEGEYWGDGGRAGLSAGRLAPSRALGAAWSASGWPGRGTQELTVDEDTPTRVSC